LVADDEHRLVVVDLPADAGQSEWDALATLLEPRPGSVRLLLGRIPRKGCQWVGRRLADRLDRVVVVADGAVVPSAGGALHIPSDRGPGWIRIGPGQLARRDSRRFPRTTWEALIRDQSWSVGTDVTAEPLPAGVWLRPDLVPDALLRHRARLSSEVASDPDRLAVILGSPGAAGLSLAAVAAFVQSVHPEARPAARFVKYGPVSLAGRSSLGQALADATDAPVVVQTGLPVIDRETGQRVVRPVDDEGTLGWTPFARALAYQARRERDGTPPAPVVVDHRAPIDGLRHLDRGVYSFSPDAVIEVVESGLLVRPPGELADVGQARYAMLDPARANVFFYAGSPDIEERMRVIAGQVRESLDPWTREMSAVVPADRQQVTDRQHSATPSIPAAPPVRAAGTPVSRPSTASERATADPPPVPVRTPVTAQKARPATSSTIGRHPTEKQAYQLATPRTAAPTRAVDSSAVAAVKLSRVEPVRSSPPPTQAPAHPPALSRDPQQPDPPVPVPLPAASAESLPAASVPEVPPTAPPPAQPEASPTPAVPAHPRLRVQPVPESRASAVPPPNGIHEERAWLRRARSREYEPAASVVARLLSRSPGLRGGAGTGGLDVITDLVAVQLYLADDGAIDSAVRSGVAGPHTALARCVAMGLRRLPSFRGATAFRATLNDAEWNWYRDGKIVIEWAFAAARAGAPPAGAGNVDFLIWSMTGRRAALIAPELKDLVLFVPGSRFKVLQARAGARRAVLLRELVLGEVSAADRVEPGSAALDRLALAGLARAEAGWPTGEPSGSGPTAPVPQRFNQPPGLIVDG
jgi:hypothetical protein